MKEFMGGKLALGRNVIKVKSNNLSLSNKSAHDAAIDLRDKIIANPGTALAPTVVTTHSQGGQFALKCLREWGDYMIANGVNPNYVEFYLAGCPEMPYTGCSYLFPTLDKPQYPGNNPHTTNCPTPPEFHGGYNIGHGPPNPCVWKIWFIVNQYDGWADCPSNWNIAALDGRETFLGIPFGQRYFEPGNIFCKLRQGDTSVHKTTKYLRFIDDPKAVTFTMPAPNATIKCVWLPTYPYAPAVKYRYIRFKARNIDEKGRPAWDLGWASRPVTIPVPDYASVPSWFDYNPS